MQHKGIALLMVACMLYVCTADISIVRFSSNPLVNQTNMAPQCDNLYDVNFPSVVVNPPDWLLDRLELTLGCRPVALMWYSNHHGQQIYLMYTLVGVQGPWISYAPGTTLTLAAVLAAFNTSTNSTSAEVASPDVYIDMVEREVRVYFHRRVPTDNFAILTSAAFSPDGIHFDTIFTPAIVTAYARHFVWKGYFYLTDRSGFLWRSRDGLTNLEAGPTTIGDVFTNHSLVIPGNNYTGYVRHLGLYLNGGVLYVYGTRVGDAPERILWTTVALTENWLNWTAAPVQEAFRPVMDYEGANLPIVPSVKGDAAGPVNQLRDPFPFSANGKCYIFTTIAGEQGVQGAIMPKSYCF